MNKEVKVYLSSVKKELSGTQWKKRKFLKGFCEEVDFAAAENPNITYSELREKFGEPEMIAAELSSKSEREPAQREINFKRAFVSVLAANVIVLVIYLACVCISFYQDANGYAVITTSRGPSYYLIEPDDEPLYSIVVNEIEASKESEKEYEQGQEDLSNE